MSPAIEIKANEKVRTMKFAFFLVLTLILFLFIDANARGSRPAHAFDGPKYDRFVQTLVKFHRKINGCPERGVPPAIECLPGDAVFDAKLWAELSKQAAETFPQ